MSHSLPPESQPPVPAGDVQPDPATARVLPKPPVGDRPVHSPKSISRWRFWGPLALQAALILAVPVQALHTQATGTPIVLQTGPVDPYNPFRGYYVQLGYEISRPGTLEKLPGWSEIDPSKQRTSVFQRSQPVYVILEPPADQTKTPPAPWKPIGVRSDRPTDLPKGQVALKGLYHSGWITYGLETYYFPEDQRLAINEHIAQVQQRDRPLPPFVVEAKVAANGEAIPLGFWLEDEEYRY